MLTPKQTEKYNRHIIIPEIGEQGQEKIKNARILVIGAGGLGCPILQYLTAAGVGTIGVVDGDTVSYSNLQRQILFYEEDLDKPKAQNACDKLRRQNPEVSFKIYNAFLNEELAEQIFPDYDMVIGATDNFPSRYIIDTYTKKLGIPFIHGSILEFEGQVSVFNYKGGPSYEDIFPDPTDVSELPLGVMGILPGIVGNIMAAEALKIVLEIGDVLSGKLLLYNMLDQKIITLSI